MYQKAFIGHALWLQPHFCCSPGTLSDPSQNSQGPELKAPKPKFHLLLRTLPLVSGAVPQSGQQLKGACGHGGRARRASERGRPGNTLGGRVLVFKVGLDVLGKMGSKSCL